MISTPQLVASACLVLVLLWLRRRSLTHKLPPGPKPLPILGNALQMPTQRGWLTYAEWAKNHGDIVYVHIFGQPLVLLNTLEMANDLLVKRSLIYSDRARMVMAGELAGYAEEMVFSNYGDRLRDMRKLFHRELNSPGLDKYWPLHTDASRNFVRNLWDGSNQIEEHVINFGGSLILEAVYGYHAAPKNDEWIKLSQDVMKSFTSASEPGAWLVDFIPALRYIPKWFPGAGFRIVAEVWRDEHLRFVHDPYFWSKANQDRVTKPNFATTVFDEHAGNPPAKVEECLRWTLTSIWGGGADTTVSTIMSFFLAMGMFPDVQRRGQEEIDRVIGSNRLPEISDREDLPFIEAISREALRWNPVVPMAPPHKLTQDDEYLGYELPAGSLVLVNIWSILHDEKLFPDPFDFKPDRFIDNPVASKAVSAAFGFGRRICPGVQFAETSIFIAIATALATSNISNAVDETGNPMSAVDLKYSSGNISHPPPFRCGVKPRSITAACLLAASVADASEC
ncbi:cytochrome P450 [Rickenella mellea]|uniref:Cytochrome P450 n=1 Tax=Rickenella mellea TaxID=50990 RepID=A0A4Y7Q4B0_9AGAM|nr:cytochrome P450 [Rickenella mellea]